MLSRVENFLTKNKIAYQKKDLRVKPKSLSFTPSWSTEPKPYVWQVAATSLAVKLGGGTISASTGSGKSLVIALIASRLQTKTLVVVPSLEIKKQLTEDLQTRFKDTSWVQVENIDSAALAFSGSQGYGCLIIDEAHHSAAKTYRKLNKTAWTGIYYRYCLTATAFRNDPEETILFESIAGDLIYSYDYKKAAKDKVVVPIEAYYLQIPKQETDAYTYAEVYSKLVVHNPKRNDVLAFLMTSLSEFSTLTLVREVKHGQILQNLTSIPFVCGEDAESRKLISQFSSGKIKSLIATTGIMGEGIDSKACEYVIIAGLGKAKSQFMQQVGRAVRNYPDKESAKIILIKDASHKFLLRHFNVQRKILKEEYGTTPSKLET